MAAPEPLQSIFESVDIAEHTNLVASAVAQQTEAVAEPLVVVAPAPPVNVVPIRPGAFVAPTPPTKESEAERNASEFGNTVELSATERDAFRELARTLGARIRKSPRPQEVANAPSDLVEVPAAHTQIALETEKAPHPVIDDFAAQSAMLDAIPSAVLVFVGSGPVFANREARDWLGDCPQLPLKLAEIFGSGSAPPLTTNAPPIDAVLVAADGREKAARLRGRAGEWRGKEALYVTIETASAPPNEGADVKARAFSANIVHEIRTPLNAILGFAEIMAEERFGPVGNDRYRQYLRDIRASGAHIMSLVNDLLDLAKLESGRTELDPVAIDANRVVRECVGMMQPQAEREKIILRQSLTERLPRVLADERALRQILLNLLSNAVKFNGPGGQVIVSTAVDDGGAAVIRVRDTGIGMDAADIDAAMQPFRQVGERKRGKEGTGLGLPLTKALADASNAGFSIKSAKDQGTLVEVAFPVARAAAQ